MSCTFIPPFLLQRLVAASDTTAAPERTLVTDDAFRAARTSPRRTLMVPAAAGADVTRVVHTAGNTETLPGQEVRRDGPDGGGATGDAAVDEVFDGSGQVLDLFASVYHRRSVDGKGTPLSITVHYGTKYDNAFWDGTQLVFGDGDGEIFDRFTKPFDVTAHEFTHGVTEYTAGLTYQGQSGALNESVSDVFASISIQRAAGQSADQGSWLIGEGIFLPGVQATALRSMKEPGTAYDDPRLGKDPQVGSMADYVDTTEDNGGVHINSGIPNRAFYLVATGIGGNSWEAPGAIWYDAMTSGEVTADADFVSFAKATVASATRLFAADPGKAEAVTTAWRTVGVLSGDTPAEPAPIGDVPSDPAPGDPAPGDSSPADPGPADQGPADPAPRTPAPAPADPAPADSAPADPTPGNSTPGDDASSGDALPQTLRVRRTGGITGAVREASIDLSSDPKGPELHSLMARTNFTELATKGPTGPDRFVYSVEYGPDQAVLGEHELGPDLKRVVRMVLDH